MKKPRSLARRPNPLRAFSTAVALATGLALVFSGCGPASQGADCDQRMANGEYDQVLRYCDNPYYRASAWLGKAGLNLLDLIPAEGEESGGDLDLVTLLGLTVDNINEKRGYLNNAIGEVAEPNTASEAFALLIASFLGMGVTMEQYLDNGAGATALDNDITTTEINEFTGMTTQAVALDFAADATPYFQVINGGTPYTVVCGDVLGTPPLCDEGKGVETPVFDDLGGAFPDGAGMLDTGAPPGNSGDIDAVFAALPNAGISVNLVLQLTNLRLPLIIDPPEKRTNMEAFLGQGDPEGEITVGVAGYLAYLDGANQALADFSGNETGNPDITEAIGTLRDTLDNGATCLADVEPAADALFNQLYAIYEVAAGTDLNPAPGDADYTTYNILPDAEGFLGGFSPVTGTDFVFSEPIGIKWLFPTESPIPGFDLSKAVPRVDQAGPIIGENLNQLPLLAPAAATAGDGDVSFIELFCVSSADDPPPP